MLQREFSDTRVQQTRLNNDGVWPSSACVVEIAIEFFGWFDHDRFDRDTKSQSRLLDLRLETAS